MSNCQGTGHNIRSCNNEKKNPQPKKARAKGRNKKFGSRSLTREKLDELVGESSVIVDWRRSLYLNLIAHTSYSVTVAICSYRSLQNHQNNQGTPLSPVYKVVKTVYASPTRVNFHVDSRKEVETKPAYPDICFAVDDFDSTFDAVVLTDTNHCFCVLLNAVGGAAFPSESPPQDNVDAGQINKTKLTLFSGFVSYQMVRDAYDAGKSGFGSLLPFGRSSRKTDRIYMKGPGDRGEVEVAVSGVADQCLDESGPHSPLHISQGGLKIGAMVRKAASVAQVEAKNAYAAASSTRIPMEGWSWSLSSAASCPYHYLGNILLTTFLREVRR